MSASSNVNHGSMHFVYLNYASDANVNHDWISCINLVHGPRLPSHLFLIAIKICLGAPFSSRCMNCPRCVVKTSDVYGLHGLLCARGESTKGHYRVRDCARELTHLVDSSVVTEIRSRFPSHPNVRPADLFTYAALPGRMAALDVGICCPDACGAGLDFCDSMYAAKVAKYSLLLDAQDDFVYRPLVLILWSSAS